MSAELESLKRHYLLVEEPGKFEGQCRYVPYYWALGLQGMADRDDGRVFGFDISLEDRTRFPELKKRRTVRLLERDDGFVVEL